MNEIHRKNSSIIIDMLAQNGVKAELVAPNSVHVDGRKISGAAAAAWQGCVLWHASILVSSDLSTLNHALAPSRVPQRTRSIRSRWHPVTTMSEVTENSVDIETVQETLIDCCKETLGSRIEITPLSVGEENAARLLYEGKYSLDDWNWKGRWDAPERFAERDGPHTTIAV
jgi:lipoate-protein ligase A